MSGTIDKNALDKSLARLGQMAKSQLFSTPTNSDEGKWAGTEFKDVQTMEDALSEDGVNYVPEKAKQMVSAKMSKGQKLTPAEAAIAKGQDPRKFLAEKIKKGYELTKAEECAVDEMMGGKKDKDDADKAVKGEAPKGSDAPAPGKGEPAAPASHAGSDEGDEVKPEADSKNFSKAVESAPNMKKGIEMSPFLAEFAQAMSTALEGTEARTATRLVKAMQPVVARLETIEKALSGNFSNLGEFNKGLAQAVIDVGQGVAQQLEATNQVLQGPARGPRAQLRAVPQGQGNGQPLQKGGFEGDLLGADPMNKALVVDTMCDLVQKGQMRDIEVHRYENTGVLSPQAETLVRNALAAGNK